MESSLRRLLGIEPRETRAVLWAFAYQFALFAGYNVMRPLRETMGVAGGVRNLPWLYTSTFAGMLVAVPLYSALVSRTTRRRFIPLVYHFFALNILVFGALFLLLDGRGDVWTGRAFYVWVSIFNLFSVSVFWSFMADVFTAEQAGRLFGLLAGGASLGSLAGSYLMTHLLPRLSEESLEAVLIVPVVFLELAVLCVRGIGRWLDDCARDRRDPELSRRVAHDDREVLSKSGVWGGFRAVFRSPYLAGICLYLGLATFLGTQVYYHQAALVEGAIVEKVERARFFNGINLWANAITLVLQLCVAGRLIRRLGVATTLLLLPALYFLGFAFLGRWNALWAIMVFQITSRSVKYGVAKPTKEVLFTVVDRDDKYKSKSFIDLVVYRGGDVAGGWAFHAASTSLGLALPVLAYATIPVCALWGWVAWRLGRSRDALAAARRP